MTQEAVACPVSILPLAHANAARLWAIASAPTHIPKALLDRYLSEQSLFLTYGEAAIILVGRRAGWIVACDRRPGLPREAVFACLTVAPDCLASDRALALATLFEATRIWAQARDATRLVGPIFFSTWWPYRVLACDHGPVPWPFSGECTEGAHRLADYQMMGLAVTDRFVSRHLDRRWPPWWALDLLERWLRRNSPITIRRIDATECLAQAHSIFAMISDVFAHNAHYTPLDEDTFKSVYLAGLPEQGIVLGAFEPNGELVGFCSGSVAGPVGILKTVGVVARHRGTRLGMGLTYQFHRELMRHSCTQAVHAMMKDDNASNRLSGRVARVMREYVLLGCSLD